MSLIGFDRDWSNRFDIENQSNQMSMVEANQRQGSKSEPDTNMEVRFSTAEARGPSLRFGVFLLLSLRVRASGTRVATNWYKFNFLNQTNETHQEKERVSNTAKSKSCLPKIPPNDSR